MEATTSRYVGKEVGLSKVPLRGLMWGAGSIAPHHALAWRAIDEVQIVGVVARRPDRGRALIEQTGLKGAGVWSDLDEALAAVKVDFVDILTPPDVHFEQVSEAASKGLDVYCQKPFTPTLAQARELIEVCDSAGVRCVVNDNWRWRDWYRQVKSIVDNGTLGTPRFASFTCHRNLVLPKHDGTLPDLLTRQPTTGRMEHLIVFEWGIHLIDVLRMVLGPIRHVWASLDTTSPLIAGEDRAVIHMEHTSGARSLVDISWGTVIREDRRMIRGNVDPLVVEGELGTLELDPFSGDRMLVTTAEGTTVSEAHAGLTPAEAYQRSYESCQRHFAESLLAGTVAENEASDNIGTLAAALAAYESAKTGQRVTL